MANNKRNGVSNFKKGKNPTQFSIYFRSTTFSPKHKLHLPDVATILQATGWPISTTFNKFYDKALQVQNNFGKDLLV